MIHNLVPAKVRIKITDFKFLSSPVQETEGSYQNLENRSRNLDDASFHGNFSQKDWYS